MRVRVWGCGESTTEAETQLSTLGRSGLSDLANENTDMQLDFNAK